MSTKPFSATFPQSFTAMEVGSQFVATDLAGLTDSPNLIGVRATRTGSDTWALDTFRVHSHGPPERVVRVDRYQITGVGSSFVRPSGRTTPPDEGDGRPGSGHYPGALPPELLAALSVARPKD